MSANKLRYYEVTTTAVVKANNKGDALALAMNRRGISGQVLHRETDVDQITAAVANEAASA